MMNRIYSVPEVEVLLSLELEVVEEVLECVKMPESVMVFLLDRRVALQSFPRSLQYFA